MTVFIPFASTLLEETIGTTGFNVEDEVGDWSGAESSLSSTSPQLVDDLAETLPKRTELIEREGNGKGKSTERRETRSELEWDEFTTNDFYLYLFSCVNIVWLSACCDIDMMTEIDKLDEKFGSMPPNELGPIQFKRSTIPKIASTHYAHVDVPTRLSIARWCLLLQICRLQLMRLTLRLRLRLRLGELKPSEEKRSSEQNVFQTHKTKIDKVTIQADHILYELNQNYMVWLKFDAIKPTDRLLVVKML